MTLNHQEVSLIKSIDIRVKRMIAIGYQDREILKQMIGYMPQIKEILSSNDEIQLDMYITNYGGFYYYIKLVEELAISMANGKIKVSN